MSHSTPSILLKNLHCSVPVIARLYQDSLTTKTTTKEVGVNNSLTLSSLSTLPLDISSSNEGENVLDFFSRELGMGPTSLRKWRNGLIKASQRRWWGINNNNNNNKNNKFNIHSKWPIKEEDILFIQSAINDLKAVISPFITLTSPQIKSIKQGTSFVATQRILPGVFLLSIPMASVFFAQPPPANDPLTSFFMYIEDLVGQLVVSSCDEEEEENDKEEYRPSHANYVNYLKKTVIPSNNLPFLERDEVIQLLEYDPLKINKTKKIENNNNNNNNNNNKISPALQLWDFFHSDMGGLPLSGYLRQRLTKEEYAWWVSLVLSRRAGAATLIPVIDKLNHHPEPNCYYTMATENSFCGIDIFDNLLAGVPSEMIYEPFLHTFSIREIQEGEELTLCYASPTTNSKQHINSEGGGISITSGEGRAAWQLQWGFIPNIDSPYSSSDLKEVASIVAERRVDLRQENFPPEK